MPTSENRDGRVEAASETPDPGGRLRRAREAQGLQLEEVANELRISASALTALEENRFDALGAAVFAKGYLKQVGTRLGLDVRELLALYERAAGQSDVELAPTKGIRLRDERQISLWVVAALALLAVGGGLTYWWGRQAEIDAASTSAGNDPDAVAPTPAVIEDEAEPGPAASATEPERTADSESVLSAALVVESQEAAVDPASQSAPPSPEASADADSDAGAGAGAGAGAEADTDAPLPSAADLAAGQDAPVLEVIFVEDSWAEITDEDGNRLYRDLGEAGTRTRLPADRNLTIYFGNASGVELRVDGEVVPVPGAARRDVVRFELDDVID